jgi:phenylalanyl-tRNA synthetase beta chain
VWLGELDWDALLRRAQAVRPLVGIPRFPALARDLAFVVDASVPAEVLLEEIRAADDDGLLERVSLFDVYRGAPVPEGRKSMAFGLSLRAADRTLTDAEADALCTRIRDRLKSKAGAEIRA